MQKSVAEENSMHIYISRVNRVIDYIKANLDCDLSLDRLTEIAHFSKFYFHRIFKAVVGETLNGFVNRMRVERSAYKLIYNPDLSITVIAYDSGFSSPSVYSREFKSRYDVSPTQWRKLKVNQGSKICTADSNLCKEGAAFKMYIDSSKQTPIWGINMKNQNLNIEVRSMPEIPIAYLRHHGYYNPQDKILFQSLFAKLMAWAVPRNLFNPPATKAMTIFSSGHPETTAPEHLSVDVCISIEKETAVNGEIGKRTIPQGQYAVVTVSEGTLAECAEAWDALFNGWLPSSGFQPGDGAYYIYHLNDPEQHPQKLHSVEMYLPVRPL
ncbi:MAG: AraC family transcriptional regulator [Gammaproteobacteria bacterium]|nr:MAG: AraC family transcriptional regulator [Gammaproteobacteria bacterium]